MSPQRHFHFGFCMFKASRLNRDEGLLASASITSSCEVQSDKDLMDMQFARGDHERLGGTMKTRCSSSGRRLYASAQTACMWLRVLCAKWGADCGEANASFLSGSHRIT